MVTAYYIMKMSKCRRNKDIYDYYSDLHDGPALKLVFHKERTTCRVCMKYGSIPIYGAGNSDLVEVLKILGNIEINENDDYPQHLCKICFKFLKAANLFRKIAGQTDKFLKTSIKEEATDLSPDCQDYSEEVDDKDTLKNWPVTIPSSNQTKNFNIKTSSKVQCYVCNKVVNKSYYKEHLTMHDPNHHKYVCDICGKSFRLRCAYHNHSLRHGNGFPFKCQFCPYKGKYAELLKTHMRTHTGDYRYMCTQCPARFLFKSNLNSHVLNKHKEREHKCDACKRAFHTKLALQRHYEVDHLGIKTHVCNICGNTFGYRNAMMKHQRRVHKREKMTYSRMPSYLQAENRNQETPATV